MQKNAIIYITLTLLLLSSFMSFVFAESTFTLLNGTTVSTLRYDREGLNYSVSNYFVGSNSYIDQSGVTPNLFLSMCHPNLTIGQKVDILYNSYNDTLAFSALNILPTITSTYIDNTTGFPCTLLDIQLAAAKTNYPGRLSAVLIDTNSTYTIQNVNRSDTLAIDDLNVLFNGSFDIGIDVQGPPKAYYFLTNVVYDDQGVEIERDANQLLFTFVDGNATTMFEEQLSPGESVRYNDSTITGGSKVYVNDILALEILSYAPCDPINESGYYVMNDSIFNYNRTCVNITGSSNLVMNFADEIIDGDSLDNGSYAEDACAVLVKDSTDITFENLRSQDYYYGVCVINSSVTMYGSSSSANFRGAKIDEASSVYFVDVYFENNESEIVAQNDSTVQLLQVNFTHASLKSTFTDAIVSAVSELPEPLGLPDLRDIDKFIRYERNGDNASAQISFHYDQPLANNVSTDNMSIYEYSFTGGGNLTTQYYNVTDNTTTNITVTYENGSWSKILTYISPSEQLIIGPTITNFSVFAPFGESSPTTPEPEPTPTPNPVPQSGAASGGGGSPAAATLKDNSLNNEKFILLNLTVPNNISVMQGEVIEINFTLENNGRGDSPLLLVAPQPKRGWDYSNQTILPLKSEESIDDTLSLAPYEKEIPGTYFMPVTVFVQDKTGDWTKFLSEYIRVKVTPRASLKRIKILEYPPEIIYSAFDEIDVSLLAENIGDFDLANLSVVVDKTSCLRSVDGKLYDVNVGDQATLDYTFKFAQEEECQTSLRFYSGDDLVGFLPLKFIPGDVNSLFNLPKTSPAKLLMWSFIFIIWTIISVIMIERRRSRMV